MKKGVSLTNGITRTYVLLLHFRYRVVSEGLVQFPPCPALLDLIGSEQLWEDGTFWKDKDCPYYPGYHKGRCSGNTPGWCTTRPDASVRKCPIEAHSCEYYRGLKERIPYSLCENDLSADDPKDLCPDKSDVVCQAKNCLLDDSLWTCKDNTTCVHKVHPYYST